MDDKGEEKMGKAANSSISLKQIHVTDNFWNKYVHLVKDVIIPYQWDILNDKLEDVETSHCIENFKIAAGEKEGEFQGAVFQDTDVAKWLEAVGFVLNYERDEKLEELADETIELIGRAQQPDGYLNTYFTIKEPDGRWSNLMEGHELYTAGHMIEAAVAYYEATGKRRFLEIVSKFADLVCQTFGSEEGKIHGYPGHQEIELALVKLYRVTREKKYLDLAKYFIDLRGTGKNYFLEEEKRPGHKRIFPDFVNYDTMYAQAHKPVRKQRTAEGHAVRANYMYSAMADLAYEYQDKELQQACRNLWDNMQIPKVRADSAKVAVVKGPLVYCVEEADNGENLSSVMVNTDQKIEETYDDELLEGCSVLHITGKKISEKGWNEGILYQNRKVELEDVKLTLVPYCYWGNRENGEMLVWMKELFYM